MGLPFLTSVRASVTMGGWWQFVVVVGLFTGAALGQDARLDPQSDASRASDQIVLTGSIGLDRLIDLAGEITGRSVWYDPAAARSSVTLRLTSPLPADDAWRVVQSTLAIQGLTLVDEPGTGLLRVVKNADAAAQAPLELRQGDAAPRLGFRTLVLEPRHIDAARLAAALTGGLRGSSTATVIPQTRYVMVSGDESIMERVDTLVGLIDRDDQAVVIEPFVPRLIDAQRLLEILAQVTPKLEMAGAGKRTGQLILGPENGTVLVVAPRSEQAAWANLLGSLDRAEKSEVRTYSPVGFGLVDVASMLRATMSLELGEDISSARASSVEIVEDSLTNSLLVRATPRQHAAVKAALDRLASIPDEARRELRTFPLRNRDVEQILSLVQELLPVGVLDASLGTRRTAEPVTPPADALAPGTATPEPPRSGQAPTFAVSADLDTNSLIAIGQPAELDRLEAVIRTLDIRQPQVMIETLVISLTEGQTLDLGVELQSIIADGPTLARIGSVFGLSDLVPESAATSSTAGPGGTAAVLAPGDFSAVIRALETLNNGRSLSIPRLLVNNNQQANLNAVAQEPFTQVNAFDTVAATSFGGFESAGTSVSVTPQIAEGDHLVLEYDVSLSAFVGESSDPSTPPPRQENSIQSVATIPDGFTVAVGGIESFNEGEAVSQVPLLGSIPIVGELFKSRSRSNSRSRFFVFIRAEIMRQDRFESLKYASERKAKEYDIDDGFPEVKPRIMR